MKQCRQVATEPAPLSALLAAFGSLPAFAAQIAHHFLCSTLPTRLPLTRSPMTLAIDSPPSIDPETSLKRLETTLKWLETRLKRLEINVENLETFQEIKNFDVVLSTTYAN